MVLISNIIIHKIQLRSSTVSLLFNIGYNSTYVVLLPAVQESYSELIGNGQVFVLATFGLS